MVSGQPHITTPETLGQLLSCTQDELIEQQFIDGKPKPDGVFANGLGQKMFAIGAYLGEVVIRNTKGSRWVTDDKDPDGEITIEVVSSNGTQMWPVQKVMKRITLGKEDALYPYILGAVNDYMKTPDGVTTQVGTGKKPWWKLW